MRRWSSRDHSDTHCSLIFGPLPRAVTSLGLMALCDIWEPLWGDEWDAPVAQPRLEFAPRCAACTESDSRAEVHPVLWNSTQLLSLCLGQAPGVALAALALGRVPFCSHCAVPRGPESPGLDHTLALKLVFSS